MSGDYCTRDGASALSYKIREFWLKRGLDVDVKLIEQGFVPAMRSARTDIRSNMVNGWPQFSVSAEALSGA